MQDAHKLNRTSLQPVRAFFLGDCTITAPGFTTCTANTPALELCRLLLIGGVDPRTPLRVYRGETLALIVYSIGEGARLEINAKGSGFIRHRAVRPASPVRKSRSALQLCLRPADRAATP